MTLVEIIQHITALDDHAHILVATPSNSSADLITERLLKKDPNLADIFVRVVGHNLVERDSIPEHLKKYCATLELAMEGTILEKVSSPNFFKIIFETRIHQNRLLKFFKKISRNKIDS